MQLNSRLAAASLVAVTAAAAATAGQSRGSAAPVGPLPSGPTSTIATRAGQLVAFALPHRTRGRVWRVARNVDSHVLKEVSEVDVGSNVVVVFKAVGSGKTTVAFALTRGERPKALESRRFYVHVR